jgi:hypothetical protein
MKVSEIRAVEGEDTTLEVEEVEGEVDLVEEVGGGESSNRKQHLPEISLLCKCY